jgi:hypothetical protein
MADYGTNPTQSDGVAQKPPRADSNVQPVYTSPPILETYPYSQSTRCDDIADWVLVQTDSAPPSNCSDDDVGGTPPGQDLTAVNIHPSDVLKNSPSSVCTADGYVESGRYHRRGSIETQASTGTHHSYYAEHARHLDPWAPVSDASYEYDVLAVGAWAMEDATTASTTYNYNYNYNFLNPDDDSA